MRDLNRIPQVLSLVQKLWELYPDMRFFQFMDFVRMVIVLDQKEDPFYMEDNVFSQRFEEIIEKNKQLIEKTNNF